MRHILRLDLKTIAAAIVGVPAAAWALALIAAHFVMDPHIAKADEARAVMCELAEYQLEAIEAQCVATGANCKERPHGLKPEVLSRRCR